MSCKRQIKSKRAIIKLKLFLGKYKFFILVAILLPYFFLMNIYIPNMGGAGLTLPLNIVTWMVMSCVAFLLAACSVSDGGLYISRQWLTGLLAFLLLSLPLLWTPAVNIPDALPRLAGIAGALVFSLMLIQVRLGNRGRSILLSFILAAVVIECGLALFQHYCPELAREWTGYNQAVMAGRPYGIFQQPNLLGSFVATGYGIAVWFYYRQTSVFCLRLVLLLAQCLMVFTLCLTTSRVGLCGALLMLFMFSGLADSVRSNAVVLRIKWGRITYIIIVIAAIMAVNVLLPESAQLLTLIATLATMFCCLAGNRFQPCLRKKQLAAFFAVAVAVFFFSVSIRNGPAGLPVPLPTGNSATVTVQAGGLPDFVHVNSSLERLNILKGTLQLIRLHPLKGSGLGSFEKQYPVAMQTLGLTETSHITHPHNELLYVWAEGGVVAVVGLFLALWFCFWPVRAGNDAGMQGTDISLIVPARILMLPILLHALLEYPLYQSAPHLLALLLLIRVGQPVPSVPEHVPERRKDSAVLTRAGRAGAAMLSACQLFVLIVLFRGFHMQAMLTRSEQHGLHNFPVQASLADTITEYSRYDFDAHSRLLLDYNRTRDPEVLAEYLDWSSIFLQIHDDSGVYDSVIRIRRHLGDFTGAEILRRKAHSIFPEAPQFSTYP